MKWFLPTCCTHKLILKILFGINAVFAVGILFFWIHLHSTTCLTPYTCSKNTRKTLHESDGVKSFSTTKFTLTKSSLRTEQFLKVADVTHPLKISANDGWNIAENVRYPNRGDMKVELLKLEEKSISTALTNDSTSTKQCAWSCKRTNWTEQVKPLLRLDPTRFLYPGLVGGPNNQLCGLMDSIYLAIRLNRYE